MCLHGFSMVVPKALVGVFLTRHSAAQLQPHVYDHCVNEIHNYTLRMVPQFRGIELACARSYIIIVLFLTHSWCRIYRSCIVFWITPASLKTILK